MPGSGFGTLLFCWLAAATTTPAAPQALPFGDGQWQLEGAGTAIEKAEGRDVLSVENGVAYRRDVRFEDGTLEFDVQLTRRRSFVYLWFRIADEGEREEIYLRPHKSGLPDAVQYTPVFKEQSAWQLYHGPGATAAPEFEPGAWTHVRVVLQGRRATLFVGDSSTPVLVVPRLAREPQPGFIGLRAFVPAGTPGQGPIARFANVTIRPGAASLEWAQGLPEPPALAPGTIRAWAVSSSVAPAAATVPEPPGPSVLGPLRRVDVEPAGFVALDRYVARPQGSREGTTAARVHVHASTAGVRAFDLGFSDTATVFLNGRPLFFGDASYSYDEPRREGLIGFDQARLYLPLVAGDNELLVIVGDGFGGWGVMGRFPDPGGLEIEAR